MSEIEPNTTLRTRPFTMEIGGPEGLSHQTFFPSRVIDSTGTCTIVYYSSPYGDVVAVSTNLDKHPIGGWNQDRGAWEWVGTRLEIDFVSEKMTALLIRVVQSTNHTPPDDNY